MRRQTARQRGGFSIIEILVVIAILILLTAISIYVARGMVTSNRKAQTQTLLTALRGIREEISADSRVVPTSMADFLVRAQALPNTERTLRNLPPARLTYSGGVVTGVLDAWMRPVDFVPNTDPSGPNFRKGPYFVSAGADGQFGTADDVTSFE